MNKVDRLIKVTMSVRLKSVINHHTSNYVTHTIPMNCIEKKESSFSIGVIYYENMYAQIVHSALWLNSFSTKLCTHIWSETCLTKMFQSNRFQKQRSTPINYEYLWFWSKREWNLFSREKKKKKKMSMNIYLFIL